MNFVCCNSCEALLAELQGMCETRLALYIIYKRQKSGRRLAEPGRSCRGSAELWWCVVIAHTCGRRRARVRLDSFPVIVTPSILSTVTHSMPGRHGGMIKAHLLRWLSVSTCSSFNNVAVCNPLPVDLQWTQWRDFQNRTRKPVWLFPKPKKRFYKRNLVSETVAGMRRCGWV